VPQDSSSAIHEIVVDSSAVGTRLDRFVSTRVPELSRSRIQELIETGLVLVNASTAKPSHKLRAGERVTVEARPRPPLRAESEDIALDVLYEDEDVIVVNKAAGMAVHAGAGNSRGTLVNALLGRGQSLSQSADSLRPGIVHRLDKDTSGAILVAKNDFAHAKLAEAFRKREVKKTYLALVQGKLKTSEGRIELAIARDPKRRMRMTARRAAVFGKAREARTDWRALLALPNATLLEVLIHTGRTHQIRAHFAAEHHPVVGDTLYGAASQIEVGKIKMAKPGRQFLHAARLEFAHPRTGKWIAVHAPLAADLLEFLRQLSTASNVDTSRFDAALEPFL
jgi:23S rRNA pseudouridine1911/1915/1917 synthase